MNDQEFLLLRVTYDICLMGLCITHRNISLLSLEHSKQIFSKAYHSQATFHLKGDLIKT